MGFPFAVSHSQLTTYQQCALKFHYKYRTKTKGKKDEDAGPALLNGIKVHKAVELFLKTGHIDGVKLNKEQDHMFALWIQHCHPSLPTDVEILSEKKLMCTWRGVPLNGYLDMLYIVDDHAYIVDLKTGNSLFFLPSKMWFTLQPDIYALLVRDNYPEVSEVTWIQHNVAPDGASVTQRAVYEDSDHYNVLEDWLSRMETDDAVPHESWECSRCPWEDICLGRLATGQNARFEYVITEEDEDAANCGEA